jgi:hypothetical protein
VRRFAILLALAACRHRPVEEGRFVLHKFENRVGEERWQIFGDRTLRASFRLDDRGSHAKIDATLRFAPDLAPVALDVKGKTELGVAMDGHTVRYAPIAVQMQLVRWLARAHPGEAVTLPMFPAALRLDRRGDDTIGGQPLTRWSLQGLIWGRETVWTDARGALVALVGVDAQFDHLEAIRPDLDGSLGAFVGRAADDGMAALAEISGPLLAAAGDVSIVHANLIDGTGAPAVSDATVNVSGDRIVGAGAGVAPLPGARVIDAHGMSVLPGLWDMHAHFEQVEWGPVYLAAGVTSARDLGNEIEFVTAAKKSIDDGRGLGPHLYLAGLVDGPGEESLGVQIVRTADDARAWVHRYHDLGYVEMKIYSSTPPDVVPALTAEAHALGMPVAGHIPNGYGDDPRRVITDGLDIVEHMGFVRALVLGSFDPKTKPPLDVDGDETGRAIAFLVEHHTIVDPTLALGDLWSSATKPVGEPGLAKLPPQLAAITAPVIDGEHAEKAVEWRAKTLALLGRLHRAGVPIVPGTDQTVPGHSLHRELELFVEAGFTPLEAIASATSLPARILGADGTIEAGKRADLILVDGDPSAHISDIRNVRTVFVGGRAYDCAGLWQSVGFKP